MDTNFDTQIKDDNSKEICHRKPWSSLIIWPIFVITIVIFIFSMVHFERDESGKINIRESLNNIVKIFNPKIQTVPIGIAQKNKTAVIKSVINTYLMNTQEYPKTLNDLVVDTGIQGWAGPYIRKNYLYDSWGNPFVYKPNTAAANGYDLISYGKDGQPGGQGDNADIIYN